MATLAEKIQCEARIRELLDKEGMPPPDEVEYGSGCIRLFFHEPKTVIVVDIDDYAEVHETMPPEAEGVEGRGPPFTLFPHPGRAEHN